MFYQEPIEFICYLHVGTKMTKTCIYIKVLCNACKMLNSPTVRIRDTTATSCRDINTSNTFPTDGKPINATLASPLFKTSKPSPFSDFFEGSRSCERYFANLAFNKPKWYSVATILYEI